MGILYSNAALLVKAKRRNVSFDNLLTIGHLNQYLSRKQLEQLARTGNLQVNTADLAQSEYADRFFETFLGAKNLTSLDYSDYQGSDIVHDMNKPIDPIYHEEFDAVIDGGSLEHVFNFPVALKNCMSLVKKGGSIFLFSMCNNHTGHGFYQFSPELFYRVFHESNGYRIVDVILEIHPFPGAELSTRSKCFSVKDPAQVNSRIGLVSRSPVTIMVHAIRTDTRPIFQEFPIQSDYKAQYARHAQGDNDERGGLTGALNALALKAFAHLPSQFEDYVRGKRQLWRCSVSNRRFYTRWYP